MIYTEAEKSVYTSPVGTRHDPLAVCHLLTIHSAGNWNAWLSAYYKPENEVERATAALQLAQVARKVFDLKPLLEAGVGDGVVLEVVDHFMDYLSKKG